MKKTKKTKQRAFSVLGDVALVNFSDDFGKRDKNKFAKEILEKHPSIKTVLEKSKKFHGRLRKIETTHLAGEENKEVSYKENGCTFNFNIDDTYFSPRLSNERKEVSQMIKKGEDVLVSFSGVGPFPIVIAKNSCPRKVISNEINRKANSYQKKNIKENKVGSIVSLIPGDFKRVAENLKREGEKFDVIVMPRPQLKDSFLVEAFKLVKKGTRIIYYDFCPVDQVEYKIQMVKDEARRVKKNIKILNVKNAGDIAPYKIRIRIDFKVI
jgi:tRNA (guanine37-N1)-methyltransferase